MKKDDAILIICVFGVVFYVVLALAALDYLGRLNYEIKKEIFKHYNVPLPKEK